MLTDRPCDKEVVPNICADTGGVVSVQQPIDVPDLTPGPDQESYRFLYKNVVVFFSKKGEGVHANAKSFTSASGVLVADCIRELVSPGLVVDLTQVADCTSNKMVHSLRAGPPCGIFISRLESASFGGDSTGNSEDGAASDSPAQVFGSGHVLANIKYRFYTSKDAFITIFLAMLPAQLPPP